MKQEKCPNDRRDLLPLLLTHYLDDTRIGSIFFSHSKPCIQTFVNVLVFIECQDMLLLLPACLSDQTLLLYPSLSITL